MKFEQPKYTSNRWKFIILTISIVIVVAIIILVVYGLKQNHDANNEVANSLIENNDELGVQESTYPSVTYLDECPILASDRYTGNEGDSFVYKIGEHKNTRGNVCVNGRSYEHGLEAWLARWNGEAEVSWAYSIFDVGGKFNSLSGECNLIQSYNTSDFNTTLEFWSDDKLLQSFTLLPSALPFSFELNIADCKELKVLLYDNVPKSGGTSFGLFNMALSTNKTEGYSSYEQPKLNSTQTDTNQYWIQFYEGFRDNRLEMSTFNADEFAKVVWDENIKCYGQIGECNQYYNDDKKWIYMGQYDVISDNVTGIVASNIDIYDKVGNVVFAKTNTD